MTTLAEALAPRSDQLNADDLIPGPRTIKITGARILKDGRDTKIVLNYEGDQGKPWKPCKTMGRAMVMAWAITDEAQMIGKSVRLYRDPEVRFGDQGDVGGIRISHMSNIDGPTKVKLTVSQGKKSLFTFHPLAVEAASTTKPDVAQQWADSYIEKLPTLATIDAVAAYEADKSARLAELAKKRPELHASVSDALAARYAALANDGTLSDENPTAQEGRGDADMGGAFADDDQ